MRIVAELIGALVLISITYYGVIKALEFLSRNAGKEKTDGKSDNKQS